MKNQQPVLNYKCLSEFLNNNLKRTSRSRLNFLSVQDNIFMFSSALFEKKLTLFYISWFGNATKAKTILGI